MSPTAGDVPGVVYGYTTDFVNIRRDPCGFANWNPGDGLVSPWREGNKLYLFAGKYLHVMALPVHKTYSTSGTVKGDVDFKAARTTRSVPGPFLCMYGHHDGAGVTEQFKGIIPAFTVVEGTSTDTDFIKELCVQGRVYAYHVSKPTPSTAAGLVQKES